AVLIDQLRGAVDPVGAVAAYEDRHGSTFVFEHGAASVARALEALRRSDAKQMRPEKRRDDRLKVALDAKPEVAEAGKQLQFRLRAEAAKVEAQRGDPLGDGHVTNGVDDIVAHVAAVQRVRVAYDDPGRGRLLRQVQRPFEFRALRFD